MLGQSRCFQEAAQLFDVSPLVSDTVGDREDGVEACRHFTSPLSSGVDQAGIRWASTIALKARTAEARLASLL